MPGARKPSRPLQAQGRNHRLLLKECIFKLKEKMISFSTERRCYRFSKSTVSFCIDHWYTRKKQHTDNFFMNINILYLCFYFSEKKTIFARRKEEGMSEGLNQKSVMMKWIPTQIKKTFFFEFSSSSLFQFHTYTHTHTRARAHTHMYTCARAPPITNVSEFIILRDVKKKFSHREKCI